MTSNPVFSCPGDSGDPFILQDRGKYYLTMTGGGGCGTDKFVCRVSGDLDTWGEPIVILDLKRDTPWARENAWAPTMVENDGHYYFAFCADQQIGIAVAIAAQSSSVKTAISGHICFQKSSATAGSSPKQVCQSWVRAGRSSGRASLTGRPPAAGPCTSPE